MGYVFSVIRFVPDPARGEFVNIGAVAGDDEAGDWEVRLIGNFKRAKAIDDRGLLAAAAGFAAQLEEHVAAVDQLPDTGSVEPLSTDLLRRWSEEMQNVVQFSAPAPIVAETVESALDSIFDQLILDPARPSFPFEKKHRAQKRTREAYQAHEVPTQAVKEHARVLSGVFDGVFDFAVHNGRTVQLVQCWSFQLPNQDELAEQVKAWSWVVHELRKDGGELTIEAGSIEIPRDLEIYAVSIEPTEGTDAPAFIEAREAFTENKVTEIRPESADLIGARAAELLTTSAS